MIFTTKDKQRFWAKVKRYGEDQCWPWVAGRTSAGYGVFRLSEQPNGKQPLIPAHRVAWRLHTGKRPDGDVAHTCGCRHCCNPYHLVETSKMVRPVSARARRLRPEQVAGLQELARQGWTQVQLSEKYGITQPAVSYWVRKLNLSTD